MKQQCDGTVPAVKQLLDGTVASWHNGRYSVNFILYLCTAYSHLYSLPLLLSQVHVRLLLTDVHGFSTQESAIL